MGDVMNRFLRHAAHCEEGKGVVLGRGDSRIASLAVNAGYGMILGFSQLKMFIINEDGRKAIQA